MRRGKQVTVEQRCYVKGAPKSLQVDIELRQVGWNSISRKDQNRINVKVEGKDVSLERPMYVESVECMVS